MTSVHQVFTVRSFRSAKDRDFLKALQIYDANTHPLAKTDSREIAHWLDHSSSRPECRFYVCGLYISAELVGFVEFIYLAKERLIHFDYFVIEASRRTAGAFYTFAEQMKSFFSEEKLQWDFISAEITKLDPVSGISRQAQRLIRLFRHVGFCEVVADYEQPLLGIEHTDTALKATLLLLPHVEMESISRVRFLELVSAIYRKHYCEWYSIYSETAARYQARVDELYARLERSVANRHEIRLQGPEREFAEGPVAKGPPLKQALLFILKICASAVAAAVFHFILRRKMEFSTFGVVALPISVFILLAVTVSLTDKKRLEAFKMLVSLVSKFFDR